MELGIAEFLQTDHLNLPSGPVGRFYASLVERRGYTAPRELVGKIYTLYAQWWQERNPAERVHLFAIKNGGTFAQAAVEVVLDRQIDYTASVRIRRERKATPNGRSQFDHVVEHWNVPPRFGHHGKIIVLDLTIATGTSLEHVFAQLEERGFPRNRCEVWTLVGALDGVQRHCQQGVRITACAVVPAVDEHGHAAKLIPDAHGVRQPVAVLGDTEQLLRYSDHDLR